jgi:uroporphyrin-III C-methyltransferase
VRAEVEAGRVYVVGAGPGDPELLTLRAAEVLARAGSIFHDQLVAPEILAMGGPWATLVDAGHRAGGPGRDPAAVGAEMARRARAGEVVCRLKGGDPFVFGRGWEDVQALAAEGVPFEVVPGVTSALAGPAAAGIPVTHRSLARSLLVVTGHERLEWGGPCADTVVVLMGVARLAEIAGGMVTAGWAAGTPAAVVSEASTPRQRQVRGTLGDVAGRAAAAGLGPPALLVVGEVVRLAGALAGIEWAGGFAGVVGLGA